MGHPEILHASEWVERDRALLTVLELLVSVNLDGSLVCAVRYLCGHVAHVECSG